MKLPNLFQFIIGFIIGVSLLAGGTAAAVYYLFIKMPPPPKPVFAEEQKKPTTQAKTEKPGEKTTEQQASTEKEKQAEATEEEPLEPGTYKARVTWSSGLSLRDNPGPDATRIGGVPYNGEIIVLKESDDKLWQKVRLAGGTQEGWIKAGNIEKIEAEN
jgi:hypothetical protein